MKKNNTLGRRFICPIGPATEREFILDWRILDAGEHSALWFLFILWCSYIINMTFTLNLTFERCTHCHGLNSQTQQTTHTRLGGWEDATQYVVHRRRWAQRWARRLVRRGHGVTLRCVKHLQNIQFIPHSTFKHLLKSTHNIEVYICAVHTICWRHSQKWQFLVYAPSVFTLLSYLVMYAHSIFVTNCFNTKQ